MSYRVPFINPREHYRRMKDEIDFAITDTLAKGDLVLRQQLRDFEQHLAEFVDVKYAVGVNSCYHALHFSLLAAGIGSGDEVITVGHTFVATVSAIIHTGAKPILVDVGDDYNMAPEKFEAAVTPNTKAVIPVHLNGRVCDMDRIMAVADKYGLAVIEDAAQALGATFRGKRAGSFGLAGCFSFYPSKNLGGAGDGGMLVTNDLDHARRLYMLRVHGEERRYFNKVVGLNSRLDALQAAVLRVTRGASEETDNNVATLSHDAIVASRTLDDALRQYLSESGGASDFRAPVVRAANRAIRLRGAADVIADIVPPPLSVYPRAREVLEMHAEAVCERLAGTELSGTWAPISDDFVLALRAESAGDELAVSAALPLVTVAAYLGELELIYPRPAVAAPAHS